MCFSTTFHRESASHSGEEPWQRNHTVLLGINCLTLLFLNFLICKKGISTYCILYLHHRVVVKIKMTHINLKRQCQFHSIYPTNAIFCHYSQTKIQQTLGIECLLCMRGLGYNWHQCFTFTIKYWHLY